MLQSRWETARSIHMERPRSVTWLALAVLILSAVNLLSAARAFLSSELLAHLRLAVPSVYLEVGGVIWGATFGAAAVGLWRLRRWGRWLTVGGVSLYHLVGWINRLAFDTSPYARQVWPWQALISVLGIGLTWGILWRPRARQAFEGDRSHS